MQTEARIEAAGRHSADQAFHYTSLESLVKILKSRSIWCTAIAYLNDSDERSFLLKAVERRLPALKACNSVSPDLHFETSARASPRDTTSFAGEAFVACFAGSGDSLMHWRAYCPQRSGVAIGFRRQCVALADINEKVRRGMVVPPTFFDPIGYLDTADTKLLDSRIREAYAEALKRKENDPQTSLDDWFKWSIGAIACLSKQQAFEVEDEIRLVLPELRYRENSIRFRTVQSTLVPYVDMAVPSTTEQGYDFGFDKPWNAIKSVTLGPSPNTALTRRSVEALFAWYGVQIEVNVSQIPYRYW